MDLRWKCHEGIRCQRCRGRAFGHFALTWHVYAGGNLASPARRERMPAFCFCQNAALWCGCASRALSWGKADLRRTAETALARTIRTLRGALDLGSLRRPSRPPAVEIPIHFVECDVQCMQRCTGFHFFRGVGTTVLSWYQTTYPRTPIKRLQVFEATYVRTPEKYDPVQTFSITYEFILVVT